MKELFESIIFVVFPILMYLVFSCYNVLVNKRIERIIFIITLCTSLYLCLNININNNNLLLFCNIPVLICYFKKEEQLGFILSLIVILYSNIIYDVNIYIVSLKYLIYFVTYMFLYKSKELKNILNRQF